LLFSVRAAAEDAVGRYWITPGGGVRAGETLPQAAVRELAEETGYVLGQDQIGPVVASCAGQWEADGRTFFASDSFFFVRVAGAAVDTSGHEELERRMLAGHRWWTLTELGRSREPVFPIGLAGLLGRLLTGDVPAMPLRLPWHPGWLAGPGWSGNSLRSAPADTLIAARRLPSGAAWNTVASGPRSRTAAMSPGSGASASVTTAAASRLVAPLDTAIATARRSAESRSDGRATAAAA
jgi:ADP-ribose pyrophosphatase YjhB (NUDIX family)